MAILFINIVLKVGIKNETFKISLKSMDFEALTGDPECYESTNVLKNYKRHGNKYILEGYEYSPTITFYNGEKIESYSSPENCGYGPVRQFDKPVIMVNRFDIFNIYEMFHSLLNTFILTKLFSLEKNEFTIMFVDGGEKTKLNDDMFGVFTTDLYYGDKDACYKFNNGVFKSSAEFTSILVTKHGALKGRGTNHHCRSALLRDYVAMVKEHFDVKFDDKYYLKHSEGPKILWSSRGVHARGNSNKNYKPSRMLIDEKELLTELRQRTGYDIKVVDFGHLTAEESIRVVSESDVMVGVHGAGLMWSAFLPRHGGLVEIFGADRGSNNRHYHNVASLSDLHYQEIKPGVLVTMSRNLKWGKSETFIKMLVEKINKVTAPEMEPL